MTTIADIQMDMECYRNLYKDRFGCSPRNDIGRWNNTELHTQAQIDALAAEITAEIESLAAMPLEDF